MRRSHSDDRRHTSSSGGHDRELQVRIEKPIYGGAFLARDEGKAVFIPLVLPEEQARIRIIEEKKGYANGEVIELVEGSADRVHAACSHFGACGGCHYQHAEYETQIELKKTVLLETLQRAGVSHPAEVNILAGKPWQYRNRIRLAIDNEGRPGYRARRSHAVISIHECPIAAPLLERAAFATAKTLCEIEPLPPVSEIALFCDAQETTLLLTVFVSAPVKGDWARIASEIKARVPEMSGAELAFSASAGDADESSSKRIALWGSASLMYQAAGFSYRVDHGAFFQVNRWLVDELIGSVVGTRRGGLAWDLYAGVGLFSRQLATHFDRVVAVEAAESAIEPLKANLAGTSGQIEAKPTLEFLRKARRDARPDLIVVDPPRTGLGADVCELMLDRGAEELVYVSCDPATLARDLRMIENGGYRLDSITMADLFPQTFHIESIVRLRRG